MGKEMNILEELLRYQLQRTLSLKFDMCTCAKCKQAMLDYLLSKFPPIIVDPDIPEYHQVKKQLSKEYLWRIFNEISKAIDIVSKNVPHPLEEDKERALEDLLAKIKEDRGIDFSLYHRNVLKRRIALRLLANKVASYIEYCKILANSPHEYEALFEALTINVSYFFRDPPLWIALKRILRGIAGYSQAKKKPIRLWSAGCAKGEEPYSLAILFKELGMPKVPFKAYGTDIDKKSLAFAAKGVYDSIRLNQVMKDILADYFVFDVGKYFTLKGDSYHIVDDIKKLAEYKYLDLTSSEYLSKVDMILCRNVFIYFTKPLQERIIDQFYHSLNDNGYLVIGASESLVPEARLVFKEIDRNCRIYQKIKVK